MDSDNEWKIIIKNKQLCNIRSCYNCNKNFVSNREREEKKRRMVKNGKWDKILVEKNQKESKSQEDKFCRLKCKFCLEIVAKIMRIKELLEKEKESRDKESDSSENYENKKDDAEQNSKENYSKDDIFFSKNRNKVSILERVKIVGMTKKF